MSSTAVSFADEVTLIVRTSSGQEYAIDSHQAQVLLAALAAGRSEEPKAYSIPEAAKALGVSAKTLHRHVNEGLIKATRLGGRQFISRGELERALSRGGRRVAA